MNRNIFILILVVLALAGIYYLVSRRPWSTNAALATDFSVKDTGAVTKIFLAERNGGKVLLERKPGNRWQVNQHLPADASKIDMLLATLHDMQVLKPVDPNTHNKAIGILATRGIKTEVYTGDKLIRTIYVGTETPDQTGTFMMLEGADEPFIIHIPGFVGFLTPRFFTNEIKWKDKLIFNERVDEIAMVTVAYPGDPKNSFTIENTQALVLKDGAGNVIRADSGLLKYYLAGFAGLYAEGYQPDMRAATIDSIRHTQPFCIVEVREKSGGNKKLAVHYKPVDEHTKQQFDEKGNKMPYDIERFYAFVDNDTHVAMIQQYNFGRIFKKRSDFETRR
jgi:hypothetical protein